MEEKGMAMLDSARVSGNQTRVASMRSSS